MISFLLGRTLVIFTKLENKFVIHIATIHWNDARWIAPQQVYLRQHLKGDFRVYAWLNNIPDAPTDSFYYFCSEPVNSHAVKLNILADIIAASSQNEDDVLIFIDGDAFPIGDIETLIKHKIATERLLAVQRLENNGDIQPHPCFCATTIGFWRKIKGDWKDGYHWKNKNGENVTDVGGNLLGRLTELGIKWMPLLRTNTLNLHPLFFGIYENVIYHHGAGFRKGECRVDRANVQTKSNDNLLAKFVPGHARQIRKNAKLIMEKTIAKNEKLSEQVYQTILQDRQFYHQFEISAELF